MAVMFNVLKRGTWKNLTTPRISRQYTYRTTTPTDGSPGPLQVWSRQSSVNSSLYYSYHRAVPREDRIVFGLNGTKQYDFYNYAQMPFAAPTKINYKGRDTEAIELNLEPHDYNTNKPFSKYATKYTSNTGIFYSYVSSATKLKDCVWEGISVAEKDAIPTLKQFDKSTKTNTAGKISTTNLSFMSSANERTIRVYPYGIVDGSTTYWFDPNDHDAKVRFVYVASQGAGGNGGASRHTTYWVVIIISEWRSGGGGGAGAYSIDLIEIPEDGYIAIKIPAAPTKYAGYTLQSRYAPKIEISYDDGPQLRTVGGGQWGYSMDVDGWGMPNTREKMGGSGGIVGGYGRSSDSLFNLISRLLNNKTKEEIMEEPDYTDGEEKYLKNFARANGAAGANTSYNTGNARTTSGSSEEINAPALLDTDTAINIPSNAGVMSWWDSGDTANIPGGGGSSQFGTGGNFAPLSDGYSPSGPGGGGGGGAKAIFNTYWGGAGGSAYVNIGY